MAVRKKRRKWRTRHAHGPGHTHGNGDRRRHEEELSKRLAPLEETEAFRQSEQTDGHRGDIKDTIRVDRTNIKMPESFLEEERDAADVFRLHPVVIFILVVVLAFTAFIAWQITLMPPPQK